MKHTHENTTRSMLLASVAALQLMVPALDATPAKRPDFLTVNRVLVSHGSADDASGRSRYRRVEKA